MNFSLKPQPIIALWIPGFAFCSILYMSSVGWEVSEVAKQFSSPSGYILALAFAVIAFIAGALLDAMRNVMENVWDKKKTWTVTWDFFYYCKDTQLLTNMDDNYFTYYILDANLSLTILVSCLLTLFVAPLKSSSYFLVPAVALLLVLIWDACILRGDIRDFTRQWSHHNMSEIANQPPHYMVFTRLGHSRVDKDGVGVFAIQRIPKDTNIFTGDESRLKWIRRKELGTLLPGHAKLYADFPVELQKGKLLGCPENFNLMTVAWYVNKANRPKDANVRCDKDYDFYALRDIEIQEELTVDYSTYND